MQFAVKESRRKRYKIFNRNINETFKILDSLAVGLKCVFRKDDHPAGNSR